MEKTILSLGNLDLYQAREKAKQEELEQMKSLKKDLRDMLLGLRTRYGAGCTITAPQIGVRKHVIYRHLGTEILFINPRPEFPDEEEMEVPDDYMSLPDSPAKVRRRRRCTIHYRDEQQNEHAMKLEGDMSELLQHGYDHLDGILAIMRAVNQRAFVMKTH